MSYHDRTPALLPSDPRSPDDEAWREACRLGASRCGKSTVNHRGRSSVAIHCV